MKILDVKQGTSEWLMARVGVPTASELHHLVTPTWKLSDGEAAEKYVARKLAEKWTGEPLHTWSGGAMEQGSILESEALPWFEYEYGVKLRRVGFILNDAEDCGCSPDGWVSPSGVSLETGLHDVGLATNDYGIEVKCPELHTHTQWLLAGVVPPKHVVQVQASMYVTGAEAWSFVSYCRRLPPLVVVVERDDKAMLAIEAALIEFWLEYDDGWRKLIARNGGESPRRFETATPPF